jgi:hypothetical protein
VSDSRSRQLAGLTHKWQKGQSGNVNGRTGGFRVFSARLFAAILDARVDADGNPVSQEDQEAYARATPFPVVALNLYMQKVLSAARKDFRGEALFDFVDRLLPHLDQIDALLTNQKANDTKFLRYLIFSYCFDEQQQVLLTRKNKGILICGRRAGKTVAIACLMILVAVTYEKGDVLYLGRTAKSAYDIIWRTLIDVLKHVGVPYTENLTDQTITFNTGVKIYVKGTNTKADIENIRGLGLRLAVKDECQSDTHDKLKMIVEEVLGPCLRDYEGSQMFLLGSPPRIEGTYFEEKYLEANPHVAKFNWNMSVNPHIPNHETILAQILKDEFRNNPADTVYLREYEGRVGVYDTEALVFRITPGNHYQETQLATWVASQPITDIFFSGGIDYGFDDQDSCAIMLASENKGERFLLYEYKGNRTGTADFAAQVKRGIAQVAGNPILAKLPAFQQLTFYCDTEGLGKKLTYDLASQFGLRVAPAYQGQPDLMLEMLQDEVKSLRFKIRAPQQIDGKDVVTLFEEEARKIIFARNEADELTRRIDDEIYHPELTKSILYAMRYVWLRSKIKMGTPQK